MRCASADQACACAGASSRVKVLVKQAKPSVKHAGAHISRRLMRGHRIAVIIALMQNGVAPKGGDLGLMRGPIADMGGKDRAQLRVAAHIGVKGGHHRLNFGGRDRKAGRGGVIHRGKIGALQWHHKGSQRRRPLYRPLGLSYKARMDRQFVSIFRIIGPAL